VANRVKVLSRGLQNPTMQRPWTIPSSLALALTSPSVPASSMPLADLATHAPAGLVLDPPTGPIRPEARRRGR
jgi:hypothetical protein